MIGEAQGKIQAEHLRRSAYLYVRQSTLRQVVENTESTERQYALRGRAVALGWPAERVVVVDGDQGKSAASTEGREGFQELSSEVALGRAGIVMGLEVSRLARNNADWHRLLEICAVTGTLILDEDGLYDPGQFNDRLLLGLKGTMSEAELYVLRSRLRGGILNKARKAELRIVLPVGFIYDAQGRVVLDPDRQVQHTLRLFFQAFQRTGTAGATVRDLRRAGVQFPRRLRGGPCKGDLLWGDLERKRALEVLRNPRYAGAFAFGRRQERRLPGGRRVVVKMPREKWLVVVPGVHAGYLSWEEYEQNQRRLRENAQAAGVDHRRCPPREGPALLQGLVICGRCGSGMTVRYHSSDHRLRPEYVCQRRSNRLASPTCQSIVGAALDQAIGDLLVEMVSPVSLEAALAVQQELHTRMAEADHIRRQQVERARYEVELARRRYMQVDPDNRLVADALEADWNEKLRLSSKAQEQYERQRQADGVLLDEEQRARVLALARDFPALWRDPRTPDRERKRMARLLIEDVTLVQDTAITAHVRFKGGATNTLTIPRSLPSWAARQTSKEAVQLIDALLDDHPDGEVARLLNERGLRSGCGRPFTADRVGYLRKAYRLRSRGQRLRERGLLTLAELGQRLGKHPEWIKSRRRKGTLPIPAHRVDDVGRFMYEDIERPCSREAGATSTPAEEV